MRLTRQAITCCRTGWRGKTGVSKCRKWTSGSFYLYSMLQVRSSNSSYDMWKSRGKEWSGSICNLRCSERICRKSDEHYFGKIKRGVSVSPLLESSATERVFREDADQQTSYSGGISGRKAYSWKTGFPSVPITGFPSAPMTTLGCNFPSASGT